MVKNKNKTKQKGKSAKLGRKIDSVETKCGVQWLMTIIRVIHVQKGYLDLNLKEAVIDNNV